MILKESDNKVKFHKNSEMKKVIADNRVFDIKEITENEITVYNKKNGYLTVDIDELISILNKVIQIELYNDEIRELLTQHVIFNEVCLSKFKYIDGLKEVL